MHVTSSPGPASGNGEAERAVKTVKGLLKADNPFIALQCYRDTPLQNGQSPAQILYGRSISTNLPCVAPKPQPQHQVFRETDAAIAERQKRNHDHHRAYSLEPLKKGDEVWLKDRQQQGTVVKQVHPRSYQVETPSGTYRRNRSHINKLPPPSPARPNNNNMTVKSSDTPVRSGDATNPPSVPKSCDRYTSTCRSSANSLLW